MPRTSNRLHQASHKHVAPHMVATRAPPERNHVEPSLQRVAVTTVRTFSCSRGRRALLGLGTRGGGLIEHLAFAEDANFSRALSAAEKLVPRGGDQNPPRRGFGLALILLMFARSRRPVGIT